MPIAQNAADSSALGQAATPRLNKAVRVNEAIVLMRLSKALPEKIVGNSSVEDVVRSLYATKFRPDVYDTLTITEFTVVSVKSKSNTYLAVAKVLNINTVGEEEETVDVFVFKDTTAANPVLGYASLMPEDEDFTIENVSATTYQITHDGDYAISFECMASTDELNQESTRMLYLYRLRAQGGTSGTSATNNGGLEQIFEFSTLNKTGESPNAQGIYEVQITDTAAIATQWKWNKELYSLVITKTQVRKGDVDAGSRTTRTAKSRIHFEWDGTKYVEVQRQEISRSTS